MTLKLKDIAEKLNISQATVSLALNDRPGVSQETKEKVLKATEEMGYNVNVLSKTSSRIQKSIRFVIYKKHGYVVSDTPFFSALIEGIDQEARDNGYNLVITYLKEKENKTEIKKLVKEDPLGGVIILATEMNIQDLKIFDKLPVPVVILDSFFGDAKYDTVVINNVQGSYQGTKYLVDRGHTEIGYLCSSVFINNFKERKDGFLKALEDNKIDWNQEFVFHLEPTLDGAYRDMIHILESNPTLPTAFFSDNDIIAFGAMKALKEKGIKIPEDISVVGFDDMPFSGIIDPTLTTIKVYKQSMGRLAVKRLIERIEGDCEAFIKVEVNTELVERKSVMKKNNHAS
jgi:LacI family transcriptional regulator